MDAVSKIFLYSEHSPLIFTQAYFWGFFAAVLAGYSAIYKNNGLRHAYLFFVSVFFYYKTAGLFCLFLFASTLVNFFIALAIGGLSNEWARKALITLSITLNLSVLAYFKYAYFFTDSYNALFHTNNAVFNYLAHWTNAAVGTTFDVSKIILPVGLSFYTFQKISYMVDVYRRDLKPLDNFLDFGFFVFFFPQLVAGPIVRATDFLPQLSKPYTLTKEEFGLATFWILNGLIKKMLVSDYISVNFIDRVFENPALYGGAESLLACYGYSLQVYCDFSGYTDIAIGLSLLMGFRLPMNFNQPHKAANVAEFWQRWHISLSSWLRDYLYIPLGGNRHGETRTNINLMVTMLLGGLWHGASWQFIIWGGLNGLALLVYRYWRRAMSSRITPTVVGYIGSIALTFSFISFTRIFFRSETLDVSLQVMSNIATQFHIGALASVAGSYKTVCAVMLFGFVGQWLPSAWKASLRTAFINAPSTAQAAIAVVVVFVIYQAVSSDVQPFIYFQF